MVNLIFEKIKNCGELGIEFTFKDGDGTRVSKDFLRNLFYNIVKRSFNYFEETGEHIFTYREKQLHSVICPSIADITPSYMMECPLTRKPAGEDEYPGHADYWVSYRNYEFLIELKHSYFAYRNVDNPGQKIEEKFDSAMEQLEKIGIDSCEWLTINNKGLIKIALQAIVFYQNSNEQIPVDNLKDRDFKELFNKLIKNTKLMNKTNLMSLWLLDDKLKLDEYDDGYPAVAFVGNISDVITLKNRL